MIAAHHKQHQAQWHNIKGFTLIEILVVVVIIAILAGLAALAIGGGETRTLHSEAKRLQHILLFAMDEASYRYRQFGLIAKDNHYRLLTFDPQDNRWLEAAEEAFGEHELPDFIQLSLQIEGDVISLTEPTPPPRTERKTNIPAKRANTQPQLLILSSGEITPFTLTLSLDHQEKPQEQRQAATLSSDGLSTIELEFAP